MGDACQTPQSTDHEVILTRADNSGKFTRVKKILWMIPAAVMAMSVVLAMTGCGKKEDPSPMENEEPPNPENPDIPGEDEG